MVGHGGVRTWCLGKRANVSDMPGGPEADPVTDDEIEHIAAVVREAVAAGALGFSTSRLLLHRDNRGILTPGALAAKKEMARICDAVAEGGGGVYEMSTDFSAYDDKPYHKLDMDQRQAYFASELGWMADAMKEHHDLRVTFGIGAGQAKDFFSKWASDVSQWPGQCVVQIQTRPQSFHMSHASGKNPFSTSKSYQNARATSGGDNDKLLQLLAEPGMREAIFDELAQFQSMGQGMMSEQLRNEQGAIIPSWMLDGGLVYPWTDTYEPTAETMVSAIAEKNGQSALEVMWTLLLDMEGPHAGVLWRPLFNYQGNNDDIVAALEQPNVIPGFDDAGAHCTILTDATCATTTLKYYGGDRTIGKTLPLELLVKTQTKDAAAIFGLTDRGVLAPGMRADINGECSSSLSLSLGFRTSLNNLLCSDGL